MQTIKNAFKLLVLCIVVAGIMNLIVWRAVDTEKGAGTLTVTFLDVGQGDAIFIETPSGNQVLVDGGSGNTVLGALAEVMPWYDRSLDLIVATHHDQDHIGGLIPVLDRFSVTAALDTSYSSESSVSKSLVTGYQDELLDLVQATPGMHLDLGDQVYLEVLHPGKEVEDLDTNEASLVLKLSYGTTDFLLTGDITQYIERQLVETYDTHLDVEVVKLAHHGSKTSSAEFFLKATSPEVAIISAGLDNSYGHPHHIVTDRLNRLGIPYLETSREGTIVFESDGEKIIKK